MIPARYQASRFPAKLMQDLGGKPVILRTYEATVNTQLIVDNQNFALYFSRSPIPFPRDKEIDTTYFKHKGIYAFRKRALVDFQRLPMLKLEATEKIEAIRFLEYGKKIKMVETDVTGIEIDTPEDLERAKKAWK